MRFKNYSGIFFLAAASFSCVNAPDNFPTTPEIKFSNIEFVETAGPDSLIVSIDFKDAEGDLGLGATEFDPPYNPVEYQRNSVGELINYSNRPSNAPDYNPIDWIIDPIVNNAVVNDTIWVVQNPNQYNIFINFYIKRNGQFTEFKWQDPPYFTTFNGRFPKILNNENSQAIEGNIKYSMLSSGWNSIFRNDTIKVEVRIQDRQLNASNMVSSPEVTLQSIRKD
ncbi:hypothetical protein [Algoriphagus machipongonensis]|uniref:Lipoprotein n=1 Tax=Algoriphagus machipongonensis TaxID=388413 RepID=E2RUA2_9BACT|nr:hypothetical protein [Algoriphagus machipongonensis]EFQ79239.1 hypothetical protein ALPR1_21183 [Algoriphagus machipongonensis]